MIIEFEVDCDYCDDIDNLVTDMDLHVIDHAVEPGADGFDYWTIDACGTDIGYLLSELESSASPDHIRITIK